MVLLPRYISVSIHSQIDQVLNLQLWAHHAVIWSDTRDCLGGCIRKDHDTVAVQIVQKSSGTWGTATFHKTGDGMPWGVGLGGRGRRPGVVSVGLDCAYLLVASQSSYLLFLARAGREA